MPVETNVHPEMMVHFGGNAVIEAAKGFAEMYKRRADEEGVKLLRCGERGQELAPIDGIHLDAANTRAIGEGLVPLVKQVLGL